ncbi:unnamed protein product [Linum trigynum]|uniref:DUF506 family protein n=1 Tax=Linum trigynum TaxID=586398 RepID=A0AAV2DI88_9ROSI
MTRRFNRQLAAAFDEAALAIKDKGPCESSGSEHFTPDDSFPAADLSDLVNSFFEGDYNRNRTKKREKDFQESNRDDEEFDGGRMRTVIDELEKLLKGDDEGGREERERIRYLTEQALATGIGDRSSDGFKRRLMTRLRDAGLEAGLCKSRWEKTGTRCGGQHDYIDVKLGDGKRYIVEVFLATEFELARPKLDFSALLRSIPDVFVGRPEELKQVVRLMCGAVRRSMEAAEMRVPPWRRTLFMEAKWFGPYRRTVNRAPSNNDREARPARRAVGFGLVVDGHGTAVTRGKVGLLKVSHLTAALAG